MRVLGLDLGHKRIGLALSDETATLAFPEGVLERKGGKRDLAALAALCREREVGRIVVGLPLHMDGRKGPEAEGAQRFAEELREVTSLPVDLIDERWTSREAERALRATGARRDRRSGRVDAVAASLLLRAYLEREAGGAGGAAA